MTLFNGFRQNGYYVKKSPVVVEYLTNIDWHLLEGDNTKPYIKFLSSDYAKYIDNVTDLKELIFQNGQFYTNEKKYIKLSDVADDIDDYYSEYDISYQGSDKFDEIMLDRGYFAYGGTRRSHRIVTDKFKKTKIGDVLNDLTGMNLDVALCFDIDQYRFMYNEQLTKSNTPPIIDDLGIRNTVILSEPPKEAPSRMIENGVPGVSPTHNFVLDSLRDGCKKFCFDNGYDIIYKANGDIVITNGIGGVTRTIKKDEDLDKKMIDFIWNIIK